MGRLTQYRRGSTDLKRTYKVAVILPSQKVHTITPTELDGVIDSLRQRLSTVRALYTLCA